MTTISLIVNLFMKTAVILFAVLVLVSSHETLDQAAIAAEVNSKQTTWKAGHNHYFDGMSM